VPFKGLFAPKRRLAPVLSLAERRELSRAMLGDVLGVLRVAEGLSRVVVVSRDRSALELAAAAGAEPLLESGRSGYRAAAEQVARAAKEAGAAGLLILPADLPLLTSTDVEYLLLESGRASVTLVPSRHGEGTNALITRPPGLIPFRYGNASFQAHLRAAGRRGLQPLVLYLPNVALDLDQPSDLGLLLRQAAGGRETPTRRYLVEIGAAERLGQ
jgi:2-phospho-L-lactate guanylyltransferase